ncbi:MAG: hypothetical protein JST00_00270 [Deltaproteobacteria bacterium]|nr:hypothetical protein [Deltaproteobacteria bacterium]
MNRKIYSLLVLAPFFGVLATGCPKKGGGDQDAAPEAAPVVEAAEAAAPAPVAKNAADISRFGAEKPIANETAKLVDAFNTVRTGPGQGQTVATLKAGTDVTKIAEHQNSFLITFADPKDANTLLMGWVGKGAFVADIVIVDAGPKDAAVVDAAKPPVPDAGPAGPCPPGQELIVGLVANRAVCKKRCTAVTDCSNKICSTGNAVGGKVVRFCPADPP